MIDTATEEELQRLLGLFPLDVLKLEWPDTQGHKDDVCAAVAATASTDDILEFVDRSFLRCRQHVYVFSAPDLVGPPETIHKGEQELVEEGVSALYLARLTHSVVLNNPLEQVEVSFLWPIHIELQNAHLIVRFVKLQKDVGAYLDRDRIVSRGRKNVDEQAILDVLATAHGLTQTDIHKGVKALWENGFFDAYRVKFKKPSSTTTELMDEEHGIKRCDAQLYELVRHADLLETVFEVLPRVGVERCVSILHIEPAKGRIAFDRYSDEGEEDTRFVVNEIIRLNE